MKKFITAMIMVTVTVLVTGVNWRYGYGSGTGSDKPILKLDTGGHMAMINKVIPMKDGRHIITCSDDKTIRIWDTVTGEETAKILGQIGADSGEIFAMALTPDERYLAVGGFINSGNNERIRIYDLKTGKIVRILKSHENVVFDLSVSSDGRYLVSASGDYTVKVWDIRNDFSPVHTFEGHSDDVYAARIFKNDSDYRIVSAGYDNRVILWSLSEKKMLREYAHADKLDSLAMSSRYIAASGFDNSILIFDRDLNYLRSIESETVPAGLAFSPDGKLLLAGVGAPPPVCNIYDTSKDFVKITSFTKHDNLTMGVSFLDNSRAVSCGGNNFPIYIWDARTGEVIRQITGDGRRIWSIGIKGNEIAWGSEWKGGDTHTNSTVLAKSINRDTGEIKNIEGVEDFKRISTSYGEYSLEHAAGGNYGKEDASLVIKKKGKETARITRDATDGYRHNTYGFTTEGLIISGGSNGFLTAYNTNGEKIASFIGHSGEVWSIALDGDTLVSGSADQTIKVWNLKELKEGKKEIYPVVSIFVSKDNEWVMWNEQGFYTASPKGDRFVGWHVNHGPENAAEYYSAKQFRRYLYRPDIIKRTLELMSGEKAVAEFIKREPGLEKITVAELVKRAPVDVKIESVDVKKDGYADINIRLGKNNTTSPERITIYINGGQALTEKQRILKNARPGDTLTYRVKLTEARNHIRVTVENQWAENSAHTIVDVPQGTKIASTKDSTLYVVAVGISKYPNTQQLISPPIDAKSIASRFKKLEGVLYKKVDVIVLTDDNGKPVTSDMVEKAILEQSRKAGPLDTTIIFLAGHGVTDSTGSYHFVTADTNLKNAYGTQSGIDDTTSFSWKRLHKVLDTTMGRRVVIVDTCQAGEVFSDTKTDISKLVKDVHDVNAIVYSGTSRQDAGIETKDGGVFTLSIVSGISGNAEYQGNILPFLNLKEYVDRDVPARNEKIMKRLIERAIKVEGADGKNADAGNTQKPVAVVPDGMEGFVVYGK